MARRTRITDDASARGESTPTATARTPGPGREGLRTVGVVLPDLSNSFWAEVATGAEAAADELGARLVIATVGGVDPRREAAAIRTHIEAGVDGLLVASFQPRRVVSASRHALVPMVLLGRNGTTLGIPSVGVDEVAAMSLVLTHLLALGHEHIVFANGPATSSWCLERRQGWRRALRRHGLDRSTTCSEIVAGEAMSGIGEQAVDRLLTLRPTPTAVVCANDYLAVDVVRALQANRLRVPEDVTVIGFDDSRLAGLVTPALTTIRQDAARLGAEAFALLSSGPEPSHVALEPCLIVRDSSGAPPIDRRPGRPALAARSAANPAKPSARHTLDDVLAGAFALVDEGGIEAATYRAISRRVGLSLGTLTYHLQPFGDLRDHLWQEVEVAVAGSVVGADGVEAAASQMLEWCSRHRRRAMFYASHSPDPSRPIRLDLLSRLPGVPTDPDVLERHRPLLRYIGRRLQTAVEYAMLESDAEVAHAALVAELRQQGRLWRELQERLAQHESA